MRYLNLFSITIAEAPPVLQALLWRHHQDEESKQKIGSGLDLIKLRRRTETGFESEIGSNSHSKRSRDVPKTY